MMTLVKSLEPWALLIGRLVIGGLFVWASWTKLSDLPLFAEEVANYQLLPAALVPLVAIALPGVELLTGLFLMLGLWTRASAFIISGLLVVFILGISQALLRGIDLSCGCFGGSEAASWGTVWRDVLMLLPALAALIRGPGRWAVDRAQPSLFERS